MEYIRLEKDANNIVELILDQPNKSVNTMGEEYLEAMAKAVDELAADVENIAGIYIRSGKPTFFGGGDLNALLDMPTEMSDEEATQKYNGILESKAPLRKLETLGVPVVVGINGAALGGGYEIALACHHRVMIDQKGTEVGLPEAQLGLMPGAGGVVRMTRIHGCQDAITYISQGKKFGGQRALDKGFVDALATDEADMHAQAKAWIKANPEAKQPWDLPGFTIPGGAPTDKDPDQGLAGLLYFGPVNVMNSTFGNFPAPKAIFACIHDVACVDFDTAEKIESRYFLHLMTSQVAKNMIRTFFFQLSALENGASRPANIEKTDVKKLGIIGAGQMGAGLAFNAAKVGIEVVLKDISSENAEKGKAYAAQVCESNKRIDEAQTATILGLIKPSADAADLAGCDLVIEAVFEDRGVKAAVTKETEAVLGVDAIFASNTSALPITELAEASSRPQNFIGMHFFSPAEKMPLVEIICGKETSDEALAKAFDLGIKLGKKPIVVNDAPGFFTTRVIGQTINEGAAMVLEGINPVMIENAAKFNGSPVGPLSAIDEISQETAYKNGKQSKADAEAKGDVFPVMPAGTLINKMVEEFDRRGKVFGAGYYEYPTDGSPKFIWPGLKEHFAPNGYTEIPYQDVKDRLTFCQVTESIRTLEEGVITNIGDGNIGSIMGIGFPAQTGGVFQFVNAYGLKAFVLRCGELAEKYGDQFAAPKLLIEKAELGEYFV